MANFNPDCTINLHVEVSSKGRVTWACSVVHFRRGRVVLAGRSAANSTKEEAEREAVLFGLRQTHRLLQEKVEVTANFPLKGMLPPQEEKASGRRSKPAVESEGDELLRAWEGFRLRRISRTEPGEAELLRKEAARA